MTHPDEGWTPRALRDVPRELTLLPEDVTDQTIVVLLEALVANGHLDREEIRSHDGRLVRRLYLTSRPGPAPDEDPYPGPVVRTHWGQAEDPQDGPR